MIGNVHFQGKFQGSPKGAQCHPQVEFSTELLESQTYSQTLQQKAKIDFIKRDSSVIPKLNSLIVLSCLVHKWLLKLKSK